MTPLRIVHTADNHLGLRFTGRHYPERVRKMLVDERFEALERVVAIANQSRAHLLVVAGDLFDSVGVRGDDIERAATILRRFGGLHLVILPGNHDFYEAGEGKLWGKFRKAFGDREVLLLDRPEPLRLTIEDRAIVLFPGPCTSKTSSENAIGWVAGARKDLNALNIGLAHGCVTGISPDADDQYYTMHEDELRAAGVDFWLLGHTHVRHPRVPRPDGSLFYFPSTHTPDGFDCDHEGFVWLLTIDDAKHVLMESIRTGKVRFLTWSRTLADTADLGRIEEECVALDGPSSLLKLSLRGRLAEEELLLVGEFRTRLEQRLAYCELSADDVALKIDRDYIQRHFSNGSLPSQLLLALSESPADDQALHLAYDLIREAQQ